MNSDRSLPHNLDIEKRVLGACMRDVEALQIARDILPESAFYQPNHNKIFISLCELADTGIAIDLMTLSDALEKKGLLSEIGGAFYLAELVQSVATSANIEYHARIVAEKAIRRKIIRECSLAIQRAYDNAEEPEKQISWLQSNLMMLLECDSVGLRHVSEFVDKAIEKAQERIKRRREGKHFKDIATGIYDFDKLIGGLDRGELFVLGARPSEGKSLLAAQIAFHVSQFYPVAFFTLEMSGEEVIGRSLTAAERSAQDERSAAQAIIDKGSDLYTRKLYFDDSGGLTIEQISSRAARKTMEIGSLGLIVIDFLQIMELSGDRAIQKRYDQITYLAKSSQNLARRLRTPVLLLSQLTRGPENEKRKPQLSDFRDAGAIEENADIAAFLYRDPDTVPHRGQSGERELLNVKVRNGKPCEIPLYFDSKKLSFEMSISK